MLMIAHLRGTVGKHMPGHLSIDVAGVGYAVTVTMAVWDGLLEHETAMLHIVPFVREDRFELFGFSDVRTKILFRELIELPGIGPKMGLEMTSVSSSFLLKAVHENDPSILTSIKGVGKKSAEKLLLELKSLLERHPHLLDGEDGAQFTPSDRDAIAALSQLGFTLGDIMRALKDLSPTLQSTEERVSGALRLL